MDYASGHPSSLQDSLQRHVIRLPAANILLMTGIRPVSHPNGSYSRPIYLFGCHHFIHFLLRVVKAEAERPRDVVCLDESCELANLYRSCSHILDSY